MLRLMIIFALTFFLYSNGRANDETVGKKLAHLTQKLETPIESFEDAMNLLKVVYDSIRPDWSEITINKTVDLVRTYWNKKDDPYGRFKASHLLEAVFLRENKNKGISEHRFSLDEKYFLPQLLEFAIALEGLADSLTDFPAEAKTDYLKILFQDMKERCTYKNASANVATYCAEQIIPYLAKRFKKDEWNSLDSFRVDQLGISGGAAFTVAGIFWELNGWWSAKSQIAWEEYLAKSLLEELKPHMRMEAPYVSFVELTRPAYLNYEKWSGEAPPLTSEKFSFVAKQFNLNHFQIFSFVESVQQLANGYERNR